MLLVTALVLVAALVALRTAARAAVTVCVLDVRDGKARVTRGGLSGPVLLDIADVVARPRIERATLRIVRSSGRAQLEVHGSVSEAQRQQLRNVVGTVPLARLARARR